MNIHYRFRICAYGLVLLSCLAYAMAEANPIIFILGFLACALSWFLVERTGKGMPRWLINVGVLLASLLLFYELVMVQDEEPNILRSLARFMVAILACKLFEKKSNRDFSQILILSLLIMVTGAIFTTSLGFGILLGIYLALALYTVLLFHLRAEFAQQLATGARKPASMEPALKRDIRFVTITAAALLLGIASIVFVLFPRNKGREFFSNWSLNHSNPVTGYTDRPAFAEFGRLHQSNEVVMEVKYVAHQSAGDGEIVMSSSGEQYLRGATFEFYSSRKEASNAPWSHVARPSGDLSPPGRDIKDAAYAVTPGSVITFVERQDTDPMYDEKWLETQEITLFSRPSGAGSASPLFAVGPVVRFHDAQGIGSVIRNARDGTLSYMGPPADRVKYQVDRAQIFKPGIFQLDNIGLPPQKVTDQVLQAALTAAGDLTPARLPGGGFSKPSLTEAYKIAERIETWLRTHYPYSLDIRTVNSQLDPVSDFLENHQTIGGHCMYFASAMVLMCRALNVDARFVTGYHGGEFNSIDNICTVRQKDAHAWVEVVATRPDWKGAPGWITFDPTPSIDSTPSGMDSWGQWMSDFAEVIQRAWVAFVVSFDNGSRDNLANAIFRPIGEWFMNLGPWVQSQLYGPKATLLSRIRMSMVAVLIPAGLLQLLHMFLRRRRNQLRPALRHLKRSARQQLTQELDFYNELMAMLRRRGQRRSASQTPREFVASARQSVAFAETDALWLVDRFYELRFGTLAGTPQLRAEISERLSRMRASLKQRH